MYNFAKLSPMSQTFVSKVCTGSTANIAAAKAIADSLPMPSFEVANPLEHYESTLFLTTRKLVGELNEVIVISAREVADMVGSFWAARYYMLFPLKNQTWIGGDTCAVFMGYGQHLPLSVLNEMEKAGQDIVKMRNGFTSILSDLSSSTEQAAERPDNMIVQREENTNLATEGFGGWVAGWVASGMVGIPGIGTVTGGTLKGLVEAHIREIDKVGGEIAKLRAYGAKAALDEGRISKNIYNKEIKLDKADIIEGAIYGTIPFVSALYGAALGSKLENKNNELKKLIKELNQLMADSNITFEKTAKE